MPKPILTLDFETDPFVHNVRPEPFACGLYDGKNFTSIWHKNCAKKIVDVIKEKDPSIIYMHNGGRFDIFYMMPDIDAIDIIINGRIVKASIGDHEILDSYAVLPIPLKQYAKDDIDINKLHRDSRQSNRDEILKYLRGDCVYLYELVSAFRAEFGDYLTIGSAALASLKKFHPIKNSKQITDDKFRKQFFFGGRVQCFQSGIIRTPFKIYDVNSMYPGVMRNSLHPTGDAWEVDKLVTKNTAFIVAQGKCVGPIGPFPTRNEKGGVDFTQTHGEFSCTIHEWNAALETKTFVPTRVLRTYNFKEWICFDEFVDHYFKARKNAKKMKDKIHDIFYKLILNSSYGKFAQNPDNFNDYKMVRGGMEMENPWQLGYTFGSDFSIWEKPTGFKRYNNVATGASITGAARATLLRALVKADGPLYCDTDSIICTDLQGVKLSDDELGAWKFER